MILLGFFRLFFVVLGIVLLGGRPGLFGFDCGTFPAQGYRTRSGGLVLHLVAILRLLGGLRLRISRHKV